jgi:hypothetical protein
MKIKINKSSRKLENKTPKILENAIDKLSTNKRRNIAHFLTINSRNSPVIALFQTQLRSNRAVVIEAEHQQCNGLLYANITRFR